MLTEKLKDWTDIDFAMHELAIILGLVPENALYPAYAHLYWGGKYYADLMEILERLNKIGVLEFNEDENQYRASRNFSLEANEHKIIN